jgi:sarcosine oxidase subunit alpha
MTRIQTGVDRGAPLTLEVNGETVSAYAGETLATALLAAASGPFYRSVAGSPRAPFCNMGSCFECRVQVIDETGMHWRLACLTPVRAGMRVWTGTTSGSGLAEAFHEA